MIRELDNVELFYWSKGFIYSTCGQFLVESESRRKFHKLRLDALSIPHYVIKKGRGHGARRGKIEKQKEYFIAFNAWIRCRESVDVQEKHYKGIHDRVLRDQVCRESQLKTGWNEQKCIEMNKFGTRKSLLPSIQRGIPETSKTMVSHLEQFGQGCTDATSIRLSSCSHNQEPSTPRTRRRTRRAHSISTMS